MPLPGSAAPPVVLVFGLEDRAARWLTRALRDADQPVMAVHLRADLPPAAAHSAIGAADAGVHLVNARQGMDATYLEYWQLLEEMGKQRVVAVHGLGPAALDVTEVAAIATRVLEEDVHPITMPLLSDDEAVVGVLDVVSGQQWFPDGSVEQPRQDFLEAVEAERNVLVDETGDDVLAAIAAGDVAVAVTTDTTSRAGVTWMAAHLPRRTVPASAVVLPGDDPTTVLVAAGPQPITTGTYLVVHGTDSQQVEIRSLRGLLAPALMSEVPAGAVAGALIDPVPAAGGLLLPGG